MLLCCVWLKDVAVWWTASLSHSMDSFFKAAVCDLDKLLDDFELNTGKQQQQTLPAVVWFFSVIKDGQPVYASSNY